MEKLYVKKPIYPLISLISGLLLFCVGLLVSKKLTLIYLLIAMTILYILFGYTKILLKAIPLFLVIGSIVGIGAALTSSSYMVGIQTLGRILLLAYASIIMVALPPVNLTRNFIALGLPRILTLGMLVTIRFVPILISEIKQISEAMKTRGAKVSILNLSYLYRAFLVPFLMRIISMSDIMAISIETRGFVLSDKSKVVYKQVKLTKRDIAYALCMLGLMTGVVLYG
jgi:energy-coupling factor transport system permease protein